MLTDIAIIVLAELLGNLIFNKMGLPDILGMVLAGGLLDPGGLDLIEPAVLGSLKEAKTVALIVILIRASLGISQETLHRIGGPAIRMGFVPGLTEGAAVVVEAHYLLELPFFESGMLGVWLALTGSDLSPAESLFCIIAYLPKATVQAAMGAVPLTMVMEGRMTSMTEASGQVILAMAVLSIVVTAPLGAIGIKVAGPRLLTQE